MRTAPTRRSGRHLRLALTVSTALTTGVASVGVAGAQTLSLPNPALAVPTVAPGALAPVISPIVANTLNIGLNAASTVITWNGGFNIPVNGKVNFADTRLAGNGTPSAVLNRDLSGNASQLLGQLTSAKNIAVWVYNPNGIVVGSGATINTGSLVLSTLAVDNTEFLSGLAGLGTPASASFHLAGTSGTKGISVQSGANITVTSGNRGLVLVAPQIVANGRFDASGAGGNTPQDVAFVVASDVTINYAAGSPLSVTLNKGTVLADAASHLVRSNVGGSVVGQNALFAIASQGSVNDALLQVDASVTTASASGRGIVLSAGMPASPVSGVTINGSATDVGGAVGLAMTGTLSSARNVILGASGAVSVTGAVTAAGDYDVAGASVALGGAAPTTQSANGAISITASGGITGLQRLLLLANADGVGAEPLALTITDAAGAISFDPSSTLSGGRGQQSDLTIRTASPGSPLTLGAVTARGLFGATGSDSFGTGLTRTAPISLGSVSLAGPLALQADGIVAGALSSGASITLGGTGTMSAASVDATGPVQLTGAGDLTVLGAVRATGSDGNVTVDRLGAVTTGGFLATDNLTVGATVAPTTLSVQGASTIGGALAATTTGAQNWQAIDARAAQLTGATLALNNVTATAGDVALTALTGDLSTADIGATVAVLLNARGALVTGGLTGGSVSLGAVGAVTAGVTTATGTDVTVSGGTATLAGLSAARDATLTAATGGLAIGSAVVAGRTLTASAPGDVSFNGGSVGGLFRVSSGGVAALGGPVSAGSLQLTGASVALGAGARITSAATVDIDATVGGISGGSGLVLAVTSTDPTQFVRLQAASASGVNFASDSRISAPASRVAVFTADPAATLTLGAVDARALVGLAAAGDNPATQAAALTAAAPVLGALTLTDSFAARATAGDLSIGSLAVSGAGQGIMLASPGALRIASAVSADGDVSLASGAPLSLTSVLSSSGQVSVTSGGVLTVGTLSGVTGSFASGTSLNIGSIGGGATTLTSTSGALQLGGGAASAATLRSTGGDISVTGALSLNGAFSIDSGGNATLNGASAGADLRLTATGAARVIGTVTAGGGYTVIGRSVTLNGTQSAGGPVSIVATGGTLTGLGGLVLTSDTLGTGGGPLTLTATGGSIALDPTSVLNGGFARQSIVAANAGANAITLGAVNARALVVNGGVRSDGAIITGALSVTDPLTLLGGAGGLRTGGVSVTAGGATLDAGSGALSTGVVSASGAAALTGARVDYARLTAAGVTITAGELGLGGGTIAAVGPVTLNSGEALDVTSVTASGAGGDVAVTAGNTARLGAVNASGAASIATVGAAAADIVLTGGVTAGGNVRVASTGDIRSLFLTSTSGKLMLNAPNGSLSGINAGDAITLSAGGGVTAAVGGDLRLGALTGGPVALAARSISAASIDVGGNLVDLAATGGDLAIAGAVNGGTVSLSATGATTVGGAVSAGGAVQLTGGRALTIGDVTGGAVGLISGGALSGGTINGASVSVTGGSVSLNRVASSGGSTLTAGSGDLTLGSATTGADLAVTAAGLVTVPGAVTAGGAYLVRGSTIALGASGVAQAARGRVDITSTTGGITSASGMTLTSDSAGTSSAGTLVLDSAGALAFGGTLVQAGPGGGAALGLNAGAGLAVTLGRVEAASIGGVDVAHGDFSQPFSHAGDISFGDVTTGRLAIVQTAGDLRLGTVASSGAVVLATTGALITGAIGAGSVDLSAGNTLTANDVVAAGSAKVAGGDVTLGSLTSGGDVSIAARGMLNTAAVSARGVATLAAATVQVDSASAGTLAITAIGDLTGRAGGRAALTSTSGDATVQAGGQARLASLSSAGVANVSAGTIDVAGQLSAVRALLVEARQALTVGDATSAGGDATLNAGGMATLDAVTAGEALSVSSAGLIARSATAGGALVLTSTGDLTLGQGQAGGAAAIDAGGLATLGQLVAGPTLTILAADAELTGIQRAPTVTITNRAPATRALRLGDDTGSDGFRLSNAELGRIDATTLTFDGGAGVVELGTAAFAAAAGSQAVRVFSTGHLNVDGMVSAAGTGRSFTIGGSAAAPDAMATGIDVVATSDTGGRLLLAGNDVELRGGRIAAGLAPGFVDALASGGTATASNLVNNGASSLYAANFGGGSYNQSAGPLLSARSLTVRYTDYALFQNTGLPGTNAGVVLGGTTANPALPALTLLPTASGGHDRFALFGTLNGVGQTAAALLGPDVLALGSASRATTRINGCLVGSGGGCLTTISIQPTLQMLHVSAADVFGAAQDLTVPFDPVIGGGNEVTLTGSDLAPSDDIRLSAPAEPPVTGARP